MRPLSTESSSPQPRAGRRRTQSSEECTPCFSLFLCLNYHLHCSLLHYFCETLRISRSTRSSSRTIPLLHRGSHNVCYLSPNCFLIALVHDSELDGKIMLHMKSFPIVCNPSSYFPIRTRFKVLTICRVIILQVELLTLYPSAKMRIALSFDILVWRSVKLMSAPQHDRGLLIVIVDFEPHLFHRGSATSRILEESRTGAQRL